MTGEQRVLIAVARSRVLATLMEVAYATLGPLEQLVLAADEEIDVEALAAEFREIADQTLESPIDDLNKIADQMEARLAECAELWQAVRDHALPHLPELRQTKP